MTTSTPRDNRGQRRIGEVIFRQGAHISLKVPGSNYPDTAMSSTRPTQRQIRRRRRTALALAGLATSAAVYALLRATVFVPVDAHGAQVKQMTIHSDAIDRAEVVEAVIPPGAETDHRGLLIFLHGRNETAASYTEDESFFRALADLGAQAPVVAFPEGNADSYWHARASGDWGAFVIDEVIPTITQQLGTNPEQVAIGGISMGGFGAYNLALQNQGRFCAVGGHSAALWLHGGESAAGAFDDAEDFARNDVIATIRRDPDAFGAIPIWNDAGNEDPFRASNTALR